MILSSSEIEKNAALQVAALMCAAARTSPKAHGKDTIFTLVLTDEDKESFAQKMEEVGKKEMGAKWPTWYGRDAEVIRKAHALVLIGSRKIQRNVPHCGYCGFKDCEACLEANSRCAFSFVDLGIAVCSACGVAAKNFVDNRIMFSAGKTAGAMAYEENVQWLGIPISVSGKNIFFDRKIFHD